MTPSQIIAAQKIGLSILETIADQEDGAPSGPMFAALQAHGCSLSQYQNLVDGMLRNQLVTAETDPEGVPIVLSITDKGKDFIGKLKRILN